MDFIHDKVTEILFTHANSYFVLSRDAPHRRPSRCETLARFVLSAHAVPLPAGRRSPLPRTMLPGRREPLAGIMDSRIRGDPRANLLNEPEHRAPAASDFRYPALLSRSGTKLKKKRTRREKDNIKRFYGRARTQRATFLLHISRASRFSARRKLVRNFLSSINMQVHIYIYLYIYIYK